MTLHFETWFYDAAKAGLKPIILLHLPLDAGITGMCHHHHAIALPEF